METKIGNTAVQNALEQQEGRYVRMNNKNLYLSSLKNIERLRKEGILNDSDFEKADSFLRKKYCIKTTSLFRSNHLIKPPFRAMYIDGEKEENNERNQSNEN
jgi:cytochrome c-type biogenesis protein CcmH/NrfG